MGNLHDLRDDLKTDVSEKTLAVVKYFNEDNYQFVENDSIIRAYDSAEKDGYITSGMKKYFEKKRLNEVSSTFMKFPVDVRQAEKLTGGDPDITELEKYKLKRPSAQSKYKDIFVDPNAKDLKTKASPKASTPQRGARGSRGRGRGRLSLSNTSNVGVCEEEESEHEVRIRRQGSPTASPKSSDYTCDYCPFTTARLNVIIHHRKTHSVEAATPKKVKGGQKRGRSPTKKPATKKKKAAAAAAEEEAEEEEEVVEEDLFDQVKRHLEGD